MTQRTFLRKRDAQGRTVDPPLHLRPWTEHELAFHRRELAWHESRRKLMENR